MFEERLGTEPSGVGSPAGQPAGISSTPYRPVPVLPWVYGAADAVAVIAIVACVLSVVGGLIKGVGSNDAFAWIASGILVGATWLAIAVVMKLLVDIGLSVRAVSTATTAPPTPAGSAPSAASD